MELDVTCCNIWSVGGDNKGSTKQGAPFCAVACVTQEVLSQTPHLSVMPVYCLWPCSCLSFLSPLPRHTWGSELKPYSPPTQPLYSTSLPYLAWFEGVWAPPCPYSCTQLPFTSYPHRGGLYGFPLHSSCSRAQLPFISHPHRGKSVAFLPSPLSLCSFILFPIHTEGNLWLFLHPLYPCVQLPFISHPNSWESVAFPPSLLSLCSTSLPSKPHRRLSDLPLGPLYLYLTSFLSPATQKGLF